MKKEPLAIGIGCELLGEVVVSRHGSNKTISCWMHSAEIIVQTNGWLFWRRTLGRAGPQRIYMSWQLHPFNTKSGKLYWRVQITPKLHARESDYKRATTKAQKYSQAYKYIGTVELKSLKVTRL